MGTHRSSAEFMEPGELAEEGEGPVGKGPVEGEGPVGIAAEPEAAPEATPIEAAAEEAKAAEEEAAAEEAAAEEAEEAKAAAEEAAAEEEEEEEALVFLALAPSRAPGKASASTLRNDEETRARVRALTTAPCTNGSPCMHALHARPAGTCSPRRPVPVPSPQVHALFESMDTDGSGHVSRKELAAKLHADGESPFAPSRTPPPHPTEPVLTSALIAALTTALITMLTSTLTTTLSVVSPPWCSLWRPTPLDPHR